MKITRETDYALRIMQNLAGVYKSNGTGINAPTISEKIDVPLPFTLKILRKLQSAALVQSFKGAGGGYALARTAEEITLLDIVTAVDGPITIHECLDDGGCCTRADTDKSSCFYHHVFNDINVYIISKLKNITLSDAIGNRK